MFGNSARSFNLSLIPPDRREPSQLNSTARKQTLRITPAYTWRRARIGRRRRLLNNSEVETHDWCGTFHFHTFQRSLLAQAPNRPSGLCSSKPVTDLAFLVGLRGTRVALFFDREGGTRAAVWDRTPVFAPYPIIGSCELFWAVSTKWLTHEELVWRILAPVLMWLESLKNLWISPPGCR